MLRLLSRSVDLRALRTSSTPTGMFARTAAGATAARRPYVLKLTGDPAFERARARGVAHGTIETFAREEGDWRLKALRALRYRTLWAHVMSSSLKCLLAEVRARLGHASRSPDRDPTRSDFTNLRRAATTASPCMVGPTVVLFGALRSAEARRRSCRRGRIRSKASFFSLQVWLAPPAAPESESARCRRPARSICSPADAQAYSPRRGKTSLHGGRILVRRELRDRDAVGGVRGRRPRRNGSSAPVNDKEASAAALRDACRRAVARAAPWRLRPAPKRDIGLSA